MANLKQQCSDTRLPPPNLPRDDEVQDVQDDSQVFIKFDSYQWAEDPRFVDLLKGATKGGTQRVDVQKTRLARILYFTRILNIPIDAKAYANWLSAYPDYESPDLKLAATVSPPGTSRVVLPQPPPGPSWQLNAPKADLFVAKKSQEQGPGTSTPEEPAYPSQFAELIQCIQEGRPVPGIRDIPNTLVRDPSVKPFGSRPVPKKPWERRLEEATSTMALASGTAGEATAAAEEIIDRDFPPLDPLSHGKETGGSGGSGNGQETTEGSNLPR